MTGARVPNWEARFVEFILSNKDRKFERGVFDCSQFCIQAQQTLYGETEWTSFIGGYKTLKGAMSKIKRAGASSLWELLDQKMERKPVLMAQRGDVIGHVLEEGESLGIMDQKGFWATSDEGLVLMPIDKAVVAWSI